MPQYSQNSHLSIAISFTVATHTSGWLHSERHSIATLGQPRSFSTSCSLLGSSIEPLIDPGNALWEIRFITWDRRNMIKGISNSSSSSTWSWEPTRETIEQREQHTPGSSQTAHCSNNTTIRTVGLEVLRGHSHSHSHSVTIRWICANISIVFGPQVALRTFATWKCSKYKTTTTIRVTATTINIFIAHESMLAVARSDLHFRYINRSKANWLAFDAFLSWLWLRHPPSLCSFLLLPACLILLSLSPSLSLCLLFIIALLPLVVVSQCNR